MACQECLDLALNVEKFALRCAKANEMFWEISSSCNFSNVKSQQDGFSDNGEFCTASTLEATVDEPLSCVRFLEVELVAEYKESSVDCIYSVKNEELCLDDVERKENGYISSTDHYEEALIDQDSSDTNLQKKPKKRLLKKKTVKSIEVLDFVCTKCSKRFISKKSLRLHGAVHLPDELKKIHTCSCCEKKFQSISNLNTHFLALHTDERPFICEECGKSFVNVGGLNQHKVTHATDRPCQCPHCPKKFKDLMHLRKHADVHNEGTHICLHCGKHLKSKRILTNHMIVHSDQKKYKCHLCDFEFKRSNTLRVSCC